MGKVLREINSREEAHFWEYYFISPCSQMCRIAEEIARWEEIPKNEGAEEERGGKIEHI